VLNGQAHIHAIGGKSTRDDFGADYASASMQDSLYDTGADRDCLSQAQVGLYFSSSEHLAALPSLRVLLLVSP